MFFSSGKILNAIKEVTWKTDEERKEIISEFLKMPDPPVKSLIPMLKTDGYDSEKAKNMERLRVIQEILLTAGDASLIEPLIKISPLVPPDSRNVIYNVLAKLATKGSVNIAPIIEFIKLDDPAAQNVGMKIILQLRSQQTIEALASALEKDDWFSKRAGIKILHKLAGESTVKYLKKIAIQGMLSDKTSVIEVLEEIGTPAASDLLIEMLKDENPKIRMLAAQALGKLKCTKAVRPLMGLLQKEEGGALVKIIQVIGAIGDNMSETALIEFVKHQESNVRLAAVSALEMVGTVRAIGTLILALKDQDIRISQAASNALKKVGQQNRQTTIKALVELMGSENFQARRAAIDVLKSMADADILDRFILTLKDEDWWVRERAADALKEMADERIIPPVIKLLQDHDETVRRYAVEILNRFKDPRTIKPLVDALNDPDWWVKERAIEALGNMGDIRVTGNLVRLLGNKELHWVLAHAFGKLGDKRVVQPLLKVLPIADRAAKTEIIETLGKLGDPSAIETLKKFAEAEETDVREAAKKALEKFEISTEDKKSYTSVVDKLLEYVKTSGGTDLFLTANMGALMRKQGDLLKIDKVTFKEGEVENLILKILTPVQRDHFLKTNDLDFAYEVEGIGRFRTNVYRQRTGINAVFRVIPDVIPDLDELNLPPVIKKLTELHQGVILVTGPSGCGKSTTVAAMINYINQHRRDHILMMEDPIEFIHPHKNCLINQRAIGIHSKSFASALKAALREDPDIIMVGELRDLETISLAITAAETGHLVISTMNTQSAEKTIDRIIDAFPSEQQAQIRMMFSESVQAILSQRLVWNKERTKKVAIMEILIGVPALRKLIRDGTTFQVPTVIMTGIKEGMQTLDYALMEAIKKDLISPEDAYYYANEKKDFEIFLKDKPDPIMSATTLPEEEKVRGKN